MHSFYLRRIFILFTLPRFIVNYIVFLFTAIFFTLLNMLHVILIAIVSRRKVELLENHDRLKRKKVFS